MRRRLWLLAPAAGLYAADIALTLAGQPAEYWAGEYASADEANPVAHVLMAHSPWLFLGLATCWLTIFSAAVLLWRHHAAGWLAVGLTFAHAVGGGSWLTRIESFGMIAAAAYIAAAAQAASWCWRRSAAGHRLIECEYRPGANP